MNANQAHELLSQTSPNPKSTSYRENNFNVKYDLQVIVPCYNVANYVIDCLDSIVNQKTKYTVDITIIEDGSTDYTRAILKKFTVDHKNTNSKHINLICQNNKGFSGARNTGLESITGRYIMFVDSDDYLAEGAIQALMSTAEKYNCDIVEGGYQTFGDRKSSSVIRDNKVSTKAFECLYGYPWGKVYKSNLFSNFAFPEGYWYEDTALVYRVWTKAHQIATINPIVYHYRINDKGITATSIGKPKSLDSVYITRQLLIDLKEHEPELINQQIYQFTIKQSVINRSRTDGLSEEVRQAAYIYMREYINTIFYREFKLPSPTHLEESLRGKPDYRLFVAACF